MASEPRNFQIDLWEGVTAVFNRYEDGKKTLTDMIEYYTKRQALEEHYAKDLQKLNSRPNQATEARTFGAAWSAIKLDTEAQMRIRYDFCSKLTKDILTELNTLKADQTKQKNQLSALVAQLQSDLDKKGKALTKAKAAFHQKSEAAESALSQFEKSQQDPTFPTKSLAKLNTQQQKLRKEAEVADQQYHATVLDHQAFQITYEQKMKESLQEFQQMEEVRLAKCSACLDRYLKCQDDIIKELAKSQEALGDAISKINWPQDLQQFINENRTDKVPPPPVEYVPYKQQYSHPNQPAPGRVPSAIQRPPIGTTPHGKPPGQASVPTPSSSTSSSVKKARALYEYTAADDTELGFDVGDIISVTKIDDSGWWEGTRNGSSGMFPGNYVELVDEVAAPASVGASVPSVAAVAAAAVRKCKVTYDFTAENPDELTIREGEIIIIDQENEGWFSGTNTRGQSGLFPANYVVEI